MRNPTKAQVQVVIDNLIKMLPFASAKYSLDMSEPSVCGTVHCHGGWYYLSCDKVANEADDYMDGARMLAKELGFERIGYLTEWAHINPDLWGNDDGGDMFMDKHAFDGEDRPVGALNLQHIIDHWREVQQRLPE